MSEQHAETQISNASDRQDLLEKLRRLEELRRDVSSMKKAATADYNDQLKNIDGEIQDLLSVLKNTEPKP